MASIRVDSALEKWRATAWWRAIKKWGTIQAALSPQYGLAVQITADILIAGLWLWLYRPVLDYLAIIFSRDDFRANQAALIGVVVLIIARARKGVRFALEAKRTLAVCGHSPQTAAAGGGITWVKGTCPQIEPHLRKGHARLQIDAAPHVFLPGLVLALGGSALYLAVERFLDINTLSASLFGLASYGLLGLWIGPRRFWEGLPAALLLVGTLPFGEHMQTFIGYPMRILTATVVRDGLRISGMASIGVDTILVLENSVAQIDLPCSGVKSLWAGFLFLIAATWVERRPINWRWGLGALALAGLLFAANLARVGILVVVGQVAGWQMMAEMLHIPLGVLGFVGACAAAVALLRLLPRPFGARAGVRGEVEGGRGEDTPLSHPLWLSPCLVAAILAMAATYVPHSQVGLTQPPPRWEWPAGLVVNPTPLEPDEIGWLSRDGAESAERWRFEWRASEGQPISGTLTIVSSTAWRAHHSPERCLTLYGLSIDDSRTQLVDPAFPLRLVSLRSGQRSQLGAYWFQSATQTTDDYATRIWADLAPARQRWVMVSIVFDGAYDPQSADIQALYTALHTGVARHFLMAPH